MTMIQLISLFIHVDDAVCCLSAITGHQVNGISARVCQEVVECGSAIMWVGFPPGCLMG